jgi:tRNA(Ser,Leu) C12 N-acetylase TAN1
MSYENEIEEIEIDLATAEAAIKLNERLKRLYKNEDFRELITEEYFVRESSRLVLLKADPEAQDSSIQDGINKSIDSIGNLRMYFKTIARNAQMAEVSIYEDRQTHAELLASEGDE